MNPKSNESRIETTAAGTAALDDPGRYQPAGAL
jgi:hypothetical protein